MERMIDHTPLERGVRDLRPGDPTVSSARHKDVSDLVQPKGSGRAVCRIERRPSPVLECLHEPEGPTKEPLRAQPKLAMNPVEPTRRATGRDQRAGIRYFVLANRGRHLQRRPNPSTARVWAVYGSRSRSDGDAIMRPWSRTQSQD